MKLNKTSSLHSLVVPIVSSLGYELVGIEQATQQQGVVVRIYIDKEDGITIDDCERVSHQISGVFEVEDPIKGHYVLEVSSPGLDRPLFEAEHFERFSGNHIKLRLHRAIDGRRNFTGLLQGLKDDEVIMEVDGEKVYLPFRDIEKARLIPESF
ncbi:MAG: ribosome maturation factor RimP [Gammaproteobacteria bacterium]